MSQVPVIDLNRGCQHTNEKWHGCSRLATSAVVVRVGDRVQTHMRCKEHRGNPGPFYWIVNVYTVDPEYVFGLGYKR